MKIELSDRTLLKLLGIISLILVIYLVSVLIGQKNKMDNYFQLHKGLIDKYKKEKDSLIEIKNKDIVFLLEQNKKKQFVIDEAIYSIDSLQKEKNKIKIVFKDRKDKIKELNSVELEKYWKDEIK
jgi:hypothetical protein